MRVNLISIERIDGESVAQRVRFHSICMYVMLVRGKTLLCYVNESAVFHKVSNKNGDFSKSRDKFQFVAIGRSYRIV